MKVFAVVKCQEFEVGWEVVGVYTCMEMANEAVSRVSDGEYADITELDIDVLPDHGRRISFYRCIDIDGHWCVKEIQYQPEYIYAPLVTNIDEVYPIVCVRAGTSEEAKEMAEDEKEYWTEKGVYGCSLEHWETIKEQLRVK